VIVLREQREHEQALHMVAEVRGHVANAQAALGGAIERVRASLFDERTRVPLAPAPPELEELLGGVPRTEVGGVDQTRMVGVELGELGDGPFEALERVFAAPRAEQCIRELAGHTSQRGLRLERALVRLDGLRILALFRLRAAEPHERFGLQLYCRYWAQLDEATCEHLLILFDGSVDSAGVREHLCEGPAHRNRRWCEADGAHVADQRVR